MTNVPENHISRAEFPDPFIEDRKLPSHLVPDVPVPGGHVEIPAGHIALQATEIEKQNPDNSRFRPSQKPQV